MEVSHKTALRDIEFMREELNLPIEFDTHRKGYFYFRPVDKFPLLPVTEAEVHALLVADKAIAQFPGTPFERPVRVAFERLTRCLVKEDQSGLENLDGGLSFRPFAPEETDLRVFGIVARAVTECRGLRFIYRKPGAKAADLRHVYPYHLMCINNGWYVMGHDVEREAVRTFALVRFRKPELTDEHFVRPKDFSPEEHLRGSFSVMRGDGDYQVVIAFDSWAADLLRERRWHSSQRVIPVPGGGAFMHLRLSGLEEVERWVLAWGNHATVIEPVALVERIGRTARDLMERYRGFLRVTGLVALCLLTGGCGWDSSCELCLDAMGLAF